MRIHENHTFYRGLGQRYKGIFESTERVNWESVKGLTECDQVVL